MGDDKNGKKKIFRSGDKVSATIQAEYYFGGAVANASVEVLVYQNQFYRTWQPKRDYAWYYEDVRRPNYYGGGGSIFEYFHALDIAGVEEINVVEDQSIDDVNGVGIVQGSCTSNPNDRAFTGATRG